MSDVFVSHVEEDAAAAVQVAERLEKAGYSTWYYERDSVPGPHYLAQVSGAIERSQAVVLIISAHSLGSHQITTEILTAHEHAKPFLPLLCGISHAEFAARQPVWRQALVAATAVAIPPNDVPGIVPRVIEGLEALGIRPGGQPVSGGEQALRNAEAIEPTGPYLSHAQKSKQRTAALVSAVSTTVLTLVKAMVATLAGLCVGFMVGVLLSSALGWRPDQPPGATVDLLLWFAGSACGAVYLRKRSWRLILAWFGIAIILMVLGMILFPVGGS
jgi:hypothetical protein